MVWLLWVRLGVLCLFDFGCWFDLGVIGWLCVVGWVGCYWLQCSLK